MKDMKRCSIGKTVCTVLAAGLIAFASLPVQAKSTESHRKNADTASSTASDVNKQPELESASGLVADADSGQIYFDKDMHARMYPASITKILTGLIAVENGNPSDVVTVPQDVEQAQGKSVANIALVPGDTITLEQLEYTMFLASANDSAIAIADHIGGSVNGFLDMMNRKAAALGATDSHFSTPNGLPDANNYTSAYDMTLIARAAVQNPTLMKYFSARTFTLPTSALRKKALSFATLHKMMKKTVYYDADVIAGKTGWETMSGNTLVTVAKRNGRTLIAVVMKGADSAAIYGDTRGMLDYAFAQPANAGAPKLVSPSTSVKTFSPIVSAGTRHTQKAQTAIVDSRLRLAAGLLTAGCIGLFVITLIALVRRRGGAGLD